MKIITTIEQEFANSANGLELISQKILKTEIICKDKSSPIKLFEFTSTDVRYGIISLRKSHELASLYSPGEQILLSINGIEGKGKWHKTQCRISAITSLLDKANVEPNKKYLYDYDINSKVLKFEEYEED